MHITLQIYFIARHFYQRNCHFSKLCVVVIVVVAIEIVHLRYVTPELIAFLLSCVLWVCVVGYMHIQKICHYQKESTTAAKKNCLKKCVRAHYLSLNINISILSLVGCCYCCCWCGFFSSVIWFTKLSKYKKTLSHTHKKTMRCFFLLQHQHSVNITR